MDRPFVVPQGSSEVAQVSLEPDFEVYVVFSVAVFEHDDQEFQSSDAMGLELVADTLSGWSQSD